MDALIVFVEDATAHIECVTVCTVPETAHMECVASHVEDATAHAVPEVSHIEAVTVHADAATFLTALAIGNTASVTDHTPPFEHAATIHEKGKAISFKRGFIPRIYMDY